MFVLINLKNKFSCFCIYNNIETKHYYNISNMKLNVKVNYKNEDGKEILS